MKNLYKIENEIYIISSSEKIKENTQSFKQGLNGDWFYNTIYNSIARTGDITPYAFKVILTTNKLLIKNGVQAIDDEFLQWFINNPDCEEVKVKRGKMKLNDDGEEIGFPDMSKYKIIIPEKEPKTLKELFANTGIEPTTDEKGNIHYNFKAVMKKKCKQVCEHDIVTKFGVAECQNCGIEESEILKNKPKQETLEEAAEIYARSQNAYDGLHPTNEICGWITRCDFIEGAKWQAEKMYSEEELEVAFFEGRENTLSFVEWFKQFKK